MPSEICWYARLILDLQAIGSLAKTAPQEGSSLSALLVAKDSTYTLLAPSDLQEFTGLSTSVIRQRQRLRVSVTFEVIKYHLEAMYGQIETGLDEDGLQTCRIMGAVDLKQREPSILIMDWVGSTLSDMIADSVLALVLGVDSSPATVKRVFMLSAMCWLNSFFFYTVTTQSHSHAHSHGPQKSDASQPASHLLSLDRLIALLDAHFGNVQMLTAEEGQEDVKMEDAEDATAQSSAASVSPVLKVKLDDRAAYITIETMVRSFVTVR